MICALFDSNVPVSAYLVEAGPSAELMRRWQAGEFELVLSEHILAEVRDVLTRPRIQKRYSLGEDEADRYVESLRAEAHVVDDSEYPHVVLVDPKDDHVLEASRIAGAHVVVTGDHHLLALREYLGAPIMTPAWFLADLAQRTASDQSVMDDIE